MDLENSKIISPTLADIYFQQGHIQEAIEVYEKLIKREPGNDLYKKRLHALKKELKEQSKLPTFKRFFNKKIW